MSEKYHHGVRVVEEATIDPPVIGTVGLQVVVGTAPVHLADDPVAAVNVPALCNNMQEARKKLGYSVDFESYTLCQSMYASFLVYAVAPVVFINVLDPARHRKENTAKEYGVVNGQAVLDDVKGVLRDTVKVQAGETLLAVDIDYLLSFNAAEQLVITMLSEQALAADKVTVESESIDPSKVTADDIIGGYDAKTGISEDRLYSGVTACAGMEP